MSFLQTMGQPQEPISNSTIFRKSNHTDPVSGLLAATVRETAYSTHSPGSLTEGHSAQNACKVCLMGRYVWMFHLRNLLMEGAGRHMKLKLIYDRQSVGQSVLVPGNHLGPVTNFVSLLEIFFRQLRTCYFVAPSLTRGRVCNLRCNCFWYLPEQSLLGRSPAELTAIFYCLI
jgi:hypothetical protein